MSVTYSKRRLLDYQPCRYGTSRINFRGPKRALDTRYVAFLGGTETFGKFVAKPFPALVEKSVGMPCVNFGCINAGVDAFLHDPEVLRAASQSDVSVIQVLGAHNMSNRFYRVHPRRNDRFVGASPLMQSLFHDFDFTDYNFTRHMLQELAIRAEDRLSFVRAELRSAWTARMRQLLGAIEGPKLLLWFADHRPPKRTRGAMIGSDPLFVDASMLDGLRPLVDGIVVVRASEEALARRTRGVRCAPIELEVAEQLLGPAAHREAANTLVDALRPFLNKTQKKRPA